MTTLLIPDSAISRFARVPTIEDTTIKERGQAGPTLTHGLSEAEMNIENYKSHRPNLAGWGLTSTRN